MNTDRQAYPRRNPHRRGLIHFLLLPAICLAAALRIEAADETKGSQRDSQSVSSEMVGTPWTGQRGITEAVADIQVRQKQANLTPKPAAGLMRARLRAPAPLAAAPQVASSPGGNIPNVAAAPNIAQTTGVNFLASANSSGPWPPDTMGDVGPAQILVCLNNVFISFNKSGVADGALNVSPNSFFTSVGGTTYGTSDPRVRYDRLSQRWFITMITVNTPNYVLIAVSSGPQVTSRSSFTFYRFQHDLVGTTPNADTGGFADYDTLGVDANALYIGVNIFNAAGTSYLGTTGYVVNKTNLLAGTLTVTAFRQMATSTGAGPNTPQGVHNDDPAATEGYFIGVDNRTASRLTLRRISNPGGIPSISANLTVTVPTTIASLTGIPCLGSTSPLDAVDFRLFGAMMHNGRLWTAHNIQVNASGAASSSGGRDGARWYELKNLTTTPALNQSGTVFSSAASNPSSYFIPTIAVSGQGHALLGCTVAGKSEHAEIAVTSRLTNDPTGTMQTPVVLVTSSSAYNAGLQNGAYRWGDYSRVTVDPNDDMTFWTFQEYCSANNTYAVRVIQLLAPLPATPASCSPSAVVQGANNVSVVVTGTQTSGSGFFDPGVSYSNHISAAVNGSGVVVNSVTYNSPTNITLNLTVAGSAATGARTITVTNPDGQTATSASGILTLTAHLTAVVSGSGTICNGGANAIQAALTGTLPWTVTWSDGYVQSTIASPATRSVSPTNTITYTVTSLSDANGAAQAGDMTGNAVVTVNALPTAYAVTGGGVYCAGGAGVPVGLSVSQTNVTYYLKRDQTNEVQIKVGTGSAITFSNQTVAGTYTVAATNVITGCWAVMNSNAVVMLDTTPPAITCPSNVVVSANSGCSATNVVLETPVTSDNCGVAGITNSGLVSYPLGTNVVTWTVWDASGNSNSCVQWVVVRDTTPPVLVCATNKTVACGSAWGFDPPAASSACSGTNVTVTLVGMVTNGVAPEVITATWVAVDAYGNTNTCSQNVTNVAVTPPVADFAGAPASGIVPLTVAFTNLSSGAVEYTWDFGDGNTSTNTDPANVYTNAGTFSVTLRAIGPCGTNVLTRTNVIVVMPVPPAADFAGAPTNGGAPLEVAFTNLSSGAVDYTWDFGDGNTSTNTDPVNVYTNAGTFSVTLTAIGLGGTNAFSRTNYIVVTNTILPARLVVSPANLDFGIISTGAIVEASFVVSNAGIATLLGSAAVEAPFSILSGTPFTLDQSISTNVVIRFAPATPGVFSGAVVFASDGGSSTNAVTGRAVGKVLLLSQGAVGADYLFSFDTVPGLAYIVQYKDDLTDLAWQILQTVPGDGTAKTVTNSMSTVSQRFYRLSVE